MNNLEKFKYGRTIQHIVEMVEYKKREKNNEFFTQKIK
jgi:hypothetical protein